ncbi:hypothetical protein LXL04_022049 [Taraxacum kok-saghyz]
MGQCARTTTGSQSPIKSLPSNRRKNGSLLISIILALISLISPASSRLTTALPISARICSPFHLLHHCSFHPCRTFTIAPDHCLSLLSPLLKLHCDHRITAICRSFTSTNRVWFPSTVGYN